MTTAVWHTLARMCGGLLPPPPQRLYARNDPCSPEIYIMSPDGKLAFTPRLSLMQ